MSGPATFFTKSFVFAITNKLNVYNKNKIMKLNAINSSGHSQIIEREREGEEEK